MKNRRRKARRTIGHPTLVWLCARVDEALERRHVSTLFLMRRCFVAGLFPTAAQLQLINDVRIGVGLDGVECATREPADENVSPRRGRQAMEQSNTNAALASQEHGAWKDGTRLDAPTGFERTPLPDLAVGHPVLVGVIAVLGEAVVAEESVFLSKMIARYSKGYFPTEKELVLVNALLEARGFGVVECATREPGDKNLPKRERTRRMLESNAKAAEASGSPG